MCDRLLEHSLDRAHSQASPDPQLHGRKQGPTQCRCGGGAMGDIGREDGCSPQRAGERCAQAAFQHANC